jgi:hypothetical protein
MNLRVAPQRIGRLAAVCLSVFLSCADIAGIDEYRVAGVAKLGPHGGFTFKNSVCGGCMAESCRPELEACYADDHCRQWLGCTALCEDGVCESRCMKQTAQTNDVAGAVFDCQSRACTPAACSASWGARIPSHQT